MVVIAPEGRIGYCRTCSRWAVVRKTSRQCEECERQDTWNDTVGDTLIDAFSEALAASDEEG